MSDAKQNNYISSTESLNSICEKPKWQSSGGINVFSLPDKEYLATDGQNIYMTYPETIFVSNEDVFNTPRLQISSFDGCPHLYGKIYWKGYVYIIQQKITEKFLEDGKKSGGDWTGYNIGEYTTRFLDKKSLDKAFELLTLMME